MHERHDVGVADMLEMELDRSAKCVKQTPMTYLEDFNLSDEAHSSPVVDSAVCQLDRH